MKTSSSFQVTCLTSILSLFLLFSTACDKEDPAPATSETEFPCLVLTEETSTSGYFANVSTSTVEYDANDLVKSIAYTYSDRPDQVITYERNSDRKITKVVVMLGTTVLYQTVIEYDPQGKWIKYTQNGVPGKFVFLLELKHDSKGMITKSVMTTSGGNTSTITKTFEYTNGDLSKMVYTSEEGGFSDHHVYEYYLDKPSLMLKYDRMMAAMGDESGSKNLVKRITITGSTDPGYTHFKDFTYELNDKGLPTLETETSYRSYGGSSYKHLGETIVTSRSYRCK